MGLLPMKTQGPPFADPNAPAQAGQPSPPQGEDEQPNVSPEEQQQYETVINQAAKLIYGKGKVMPAILDALKPQGSQQEGQQPDPNSPDGAAKGNPAIMSLANTATQVVSKLDASAKEAGQPISDDVLYHAGSEIVGMLAEVAEAAGFHDYSEEEIQGAFYQAVDNYRPIAEAMGRTSQDALKGEFGKVMDADAQGQLGQLLPGLGDQQPQQQ